LPIIVEHEQAAVFYFDLNGFKLINDRFGRQAGDAWLKAFSHRATGRFR
jgi:GGDEF domain-containing protein